MSFLEDKFHKAWEVFAPSSLPDPVTQFQFHPVRRWRFDFSWPELKLAIEINGSSGFGRGAHAGTASKLRNEIEKLNEAQRLGWRVLQFNDYYLRNCRISDTIEYVVAVLIEAKEIKTPAKSRRKIC